MARKNLIKILRDNPGCVGIIDNDSWYLYKVHPNENPFDIDPAHLSEKEQTKLWRDYAKWDKANQLACYEDTFRPSLGDGGAGSGSSYGGDIMQAMAVILGVTLESV